MKQNPRSQRRLRVAIVGAGKVGSVLGRVLVEEGARITAVVSRTRGSARAAGAYLRCRNFSTALTAIPVETDLVFITTPHDAVGDVARTLARLEGLDFTHLSVCHASGMLTSAALDPLALRGSTVFSFHPLQTFPRDFRPKDILPSARGIYFGVDGPAKGIRMARRLAAVLQGHILEIPPAMREFYHATCVVASNHVTTLLSVIESMYRTIRPRDPDFAPPFLPIIRATLDNIAASSPAAALSGPIARGGVQTVARHLESVKQFAPETLPYFTRMSLETVRLATVKGSLTPDLREALEMLIRSYTDGTTPAMERS